MPARKDDLASRLAPHVGGTAGRLTLDDGSRVAVVGGGPAGSLFCHFLLKMADSVGTDLLVDLYEPRSFAYCGPAGCNHCGGIVSESLVQLLAAEGINLPVEVVQRGIDSYMLHMDVGDVRIETPLREKRIAAVYRGNGPRDSKVSDISSFDGYLQQLAAKAGARLVRKLVTGITREDGRPVLRCPDGSRQTYDLVAVAAGINSNILKNFEGLDLGFHPPGTVKTFICEFHLGREVIARYLGTSMHVFLLDLPRLEFAAIIPKGDFVTLCMLGHEIDDQLVESFLNSPEVKNCFPGAQVPKNACHCFPRINVQAAVQPFADRVVFIGDAGVSRLYKDGIGAAYRTAKAAARTAVFHGLSEEDFRQNFWPACRTLNLDNSIGKVIFAFSHFFQKKRFSRKAILRMVTCEQASTDGARHMSRVLWDVFTGSAPYREVMVRTMHPGFGLGLLWNLVAGNWPSKKVTGDADGQ